MNKSFIFTKTGNKYWHFHPIGVGVIYNYMVKAQQVITTHELTGKIIESFDVKFDTPEEFKQDCKKIYLDMVNNNLTIVLDYMDDPTIIGPIGADFKLLAN